MAEYANPNSPADSSGKSGTAFAAEISSASPATLINLLDDPRMDDAHLCLLLSRKDLSANVLDELARRRDLPHGYRVIRAFAFHPNVSRKLALRLLRELHLMDLMKLSRAAATPSDLQRSAEEHLIARLPHVALGQKIALARQASARVLGVLILEGNAQVVEPAVENPRLTEAQVLKLLAGNKLPVAVVPALCRQPRWTSVPNVIKALMRYPHTPPEAAQQILPGISSNELRELSQKKTISQRLRRQIERELAQRSSL
jgi:hypothetical protein